LFATDVAAVQFAFASVVVLPFPSVEVGAIVSTTSLYVSFYYFLLFAKLKLL